MSEKSPPVAPPDSEPGSGSGQELSPVAESPARPAPEKPAEPSSDRERINPDEAQVDEDVKERLLGPQYERQRYTRNRATGPSMWGNSNTQNVYSPRMTSVFRRPADIERLTEWYALTEGKEVERALHDALDRHTTICLSGEPDSGRFSTACYTLVERFGAEHVEEILPPLDEAPARAFQRLTADDLCPATGYLVRIEAADPLPVISRLDALVRSVDSRLVLIRDRSARDSSHGDNEIRHLPPNPGEVFRSHVQYLGRQSGTDVGGHLRLANWDSLPSRPRQVARLATEAVRRTVADAERFLIEGNAGTLREKAEKILGVTDDAGGGRARRRLPQHRRAFRIAYAAMAGQPIGHVFEATGLLLKALDAESGWTDIGRTALEHPVATLLGDPLANQWLSAHNPRRLAQVDDDLVREIFDVVWHEFDHTRPALLTWLNAMVASADPTSREAAIRVTVKLALIDFDGIWRAAIDEWSRSPRSRVRLSAAQAILILASANGVNQLVARRVHGWVTGGSKLRRDTAALAYAGGLMLTDPHWVLADLRIIAQDAMQRLDWTIATAVRRLLGPDRGPLIVQTLAGWIQTDVPDLVVTQHAARSFTRMLTVPREGRSGSPPALLLDLAESAVPMRDLTLLWRAALRDPSTWRQAWSGLLLWLGHAHTDPALRRPLVEMVQAMAVAVPLRRRLVRCLTRPDTPDWIIAAMKEWTR
jgi:hypothetical protein